MLINFVKRAKVDVGVEHKIVDSLGIVIIVVILTDNKHCVFVDNVRLTSNERTFVSG